MPESKAIQSLTANVRDEATRARVEITAIAPMENEVFAKRMVELIRHLQAEAEKELNRIKAASGL